MSTLLVILGSIRLHMKCHVMHMSSAIDWLR